MADVPVALLTKIRALLAQAESTTFAAEAEAFTAKAQELMARYRIDRALLDQRAGPVRADGVDTRLITIADPYASAKFFLLAGIAAANGARALWDRYANEATVLGFPVDLDVVEELFTSLLLQATATLNRAGPKRDEEGRNRTRAFRRSFLVAFASRVSARLHEAVQHTVEEVSDEVGADLVPMLAEREGVVDAKLDELFPDVQRMPTTVSDTEGLLAGRLAGDQADLSTGPRLDRRPA